MSLEDSSPVDIIDEVNADYIAIHLKEKFNEWIYATVDNYKIVKRKIDKYKCKLSKTDTYINFNYTHLLQKLYQIDDINIFYPHGECTEQDSSLVVGHGDNETIQKLTNEINHMETKYNYTQASRNRIDEKTCMKSFLLALKKDVESTRINIVNFLLKVPYNIDEIYVFGFSFGEVDMPYITDIHNLFPNAKWNISYFELDEDEKEKEKKIISYIGNKKKNVNFFEFNKPISNEMRSSMPVKSVSLSF